MDTRLENLFKDRNMTETWTGKCASMLYQAAINGSKASIIASLVDKKGVRVTDNSSSWKTEDVWGININTCYEYCSREAFPMVCYSSL
jgi:hypothetical protein